MIELNFNYVWVTQKLKVRTKWVQRYVLHCTFCVYYFICKWTSHFRIVIDLWLQPPFLWRVKKVRYTAKVLYLSDWEERKANHFHWYPFLKSSVSISVTRRSVLAYVCSYGYWGQPRLLTWHLSSRLWHERMMTIRCPYGSVSSLGSLSSSNVRMESL